MAVINPIDKTKLSDTMRCFNCEENLYVEAIEGIDYVVPCEDCLFAEQMKWR